LQFLTEVGSDVTAIKYNNTLYYLEKNIQGDVIGLINTSGTRVAKYTYDAWGNLCSVTDGNGTSVASNASHIANINPLRYRGYYFDRETGLYYCQSRYYDPQVGRFINADGYIGGVGGDIRGYNLFAYCMNNPVNMNDSNGNWPNLIKNVVDVVKKITSSVINAVAPKSIPSIVKTSKNDFPITGDPGSDRILPNPDGTPKQKRWYGPDGNVVRDRDYNHPGDMPFPHDHEWENGERGKDHLPPDPSYKMDWDTALGVGLVTVCVIGIIIVAADDTTGVGVLDDFLFGPLGAGVGKGLTMIFG